MCHSNIVSNSIVILVFVENCIVFENLCVLTLRVSFTANGLQLIAVYS